MLSSVIILVLFSLKDTPVFGLTSPFANYLNSGINLTPIKDTFVDSNYPETNFYDVDEILTQMGIGEALVTLLNEKGIPTPLVHTYLLPPATRMDVLTEDEIHKIVGASALVKKYGTLVDNESAYEMLTEKLAEAAKNAGEDAAAKEAEKPGRKAPREESIFDNTIVKQAGRTAASIITRSLLGALGLSSTGRKRKKGLFG